MEQTNDIEIQPAINNNINAGFRLQYLEVLNWGTFDKACWQIQPNGYNALLTGDIGSGKSTLVDALTCLLVPHNKIVFNKAAGAEGKERNLLSYVKGEYKKEKEEITKIAKKIYLRPDDNTYSVIIGNFHNDGYDENICLTQVFWIGKDGKVEKLLIIATTPLSVKQHFSGFTDINDLRKKLRNTESIQLFTDNFSQYSEYFRRIFGMNSDKAIDLFYQTVSMKSVNSLTDFVREQMLERTDVKDQISSLLKRFDDLNKAHAAVVHAREQYQILKPLAEYSIDYGKISREIENIEAMLEIMPAWFATQSIQLLKKSVLEAQNELDKAIQQQTQLGIEKENLENKRISILQDIDNNGGKRIEQIAEEIRRHEHDKIAKKKDFDVHDLLTRQCGLEVIQGETDFHRNLQKANYANEQCDIKGSGLRLERDGIVSELRKLESEYKIEEQELQSLKERKTQIPGWLVGFRMQLCTDLLISEDELPFVGELLKVNDQEIAWEGAAEKLLHDAGISLLVPRQHYKSVSKYINENTLKSLDGKGIKLTYLDADTDNINRINKKLENDSIVYKIDIKPDTYFYDWLESYLHRSFGDYLCVEVNELQHIPYGITRQGLVKSGRSRHTKDDRRNILDKRHYVLGWTNTEKIKALESLLSELYEKVQVHTSQKTAIESQQRSIETLRQQLGIVLSVTDFSRINWQYHVEKIDLLEKEKHELLNNNDTLALLQKKKVEVEDFLNQIKEKEKNISEKAGGFKRDISNYEDQLSDSFYTLEDISETQKDKWFPFITEKMEGISITLKNLSTRQEDFRKQFQGETGELKKMRNKQSLLRSSIERQMGAIKEHSKAEYSEIAQTLEARAEYLRKFEQLSTEDLKRHEERFKEELNKNTINSIAVFDSQLEKHEKDIKQKIKTINQHLHEIIYNTVQDTYITIQMDTTTNKDVRLFKEELKKCYIHSFSSNNDLYTEEKYEQVKKILDKFASADNSNKEWTNTVTDVRQWFEFNASERYRSDNSEKEFYESSGGKSGGQKEKLAYTILASALAYQFGLQFGESKSRSFRFVVIDEAFGRGSDESTRYGLELFRKLNLQLLIVTPLQKIHVIEDHVNSFHFISNRESNNSQVSNFTKEEYEEEKIRRNNLFKIINQVEE